eukprot:1049416-Prymnesium_polylepis.1
MEQARRVELLARRPIERVERDADLARPRLMQVIEVDHVVDATLRQSAEQQQVLGTLRVMRCRPAHARIRRIDRLQLHSAVGTARDDPRNHPCALLARHPSQCLVEAERRAVRRVAVRRGRCCG